MKNKILLLVASGIVLLTVLLLAPRYKKNSAPVANNTAKSQNQHQEITIDWLLEESKKHLDSNSLFRIKNIEEQITTAKHHEDSSMAFFTLSKYWKDSLSNFPVAAYYLKKFALLDNSEKNLTFAAQLLADSILVTQQADLQHWYALQAKELIDVLQNKAIKTEEVTISLAICYMFGNLSNNPMQGILPLRELVEKNPKNIKAQLILAMGGRKSGQYDKAIERLKAVLEIEPNNMEALVNIAECYELSNDNANAIVWYKELKKHVPNPNIRAEIDNRIKSLSR